MNQQEQRYANRGETGPVTCNATSSSTRIPTKILLDGQYRGYFGLEETASLDITNMLANSETSYTTDITYINTISSATVRCTVTFNDGSTKIAEMEVTMGIDCKITQPLEFGSYSIPVDETFETGTSVEAECDPGYQLHGQTSYTCSFGSLWTFDTAPECRRELNF